MKLNLYLFKDYIDKAIKEKKPCHIFLKNQPITYNWRNNHELCIANYERMKQSRKRIIQQRDKLQTKNKELTKRNNNLQEYKKLKSENNNLYSSLQRANANIQTLKIQNDHYRAEKEEYERKYNLLITQLRMLEEI